MKSLDERDGKILAELTRDARQSTADIARKTRIPRVTVHERVQRLRESGVIKRFTVESDFVKLGKPTTAFILVSFAPWHGTTQLELAKAIAKLPGVHAVHIIAAESDILVKVRSASMDTLGQLVETLRNLDGVYKTTTMPVLTEVKDGY